MISLSLIVLLLPFLSFIILSFSGKKALVFADILAVSLMGIAFLISSRIFFYVFINGASHAQFDWITIGDTVVQLGVKLDSISALMLVLITLISFLVHLYSMEYMKGEKNYVRYWAHLSLFCFSMLGLVLADNLLVIYIFWELVGFTSYLLIGFWFTKDSAALASRKAFIVNRIGDVAMFIGLLIIFSQFKTFDLGLILQSFHSSILQSSWMTAGGICLFTGAVAKSAQFPLHVWLPDAMEGPTPISSLIHAATMVAAGVYLLVRIFFLLHADVLVVVATVGSFTAFMAASIALTQHDIKRVLAYSTVSQLGLMVAAIGFGAVSAAMSHLATHAFFKCLLFLCAGAVIHHLKHLPAETGNTDYQDMRNMGGLRKQLPLVFYAYLFGAASLIGLPFFSGFLSKDTILSASLNYADMNRGYAYLFPVLNFGTVLLTAFYIARQFFLVFASPANINATPANISARMRIPMIVLAGFCVFIFFSLNPFSMHSGWMINYLQLPGAISESYVTILLSLVLSGAGIYLAWHRYILKRAVVFPGKRLLYNLSYREWYVDEAYRYLVVNPLIMLSEYCHQFDKKVIDAFVNFWAYFAVKVSDVVDWVDRRIVDGAVNFVAQLAAFLGNLLRSFQTGKVQTYIALVFVAVVLFYLWIIG